jgi:pimeloyl-ACP methyl ester carboxylesterase
MKNIRGFLVCMLMFWCFVPARADVLVLVHGWAANADTWLYSGVVPVLEANGWANAGVVFSLPNGGISHSATYGNSAANKIYRVHLPAEAPLQLQAAYLFAELQYIHQLHPSENILIAGHSAGGVVARLVLVRANSLPIKSLITIASPNLGTPRALQGLDIAESKPFFCPGPGVDFLKTLVGGDSYRYLRHSRGALVDMIPATAGSLIGWLNQQPHPDIHYHAVVRQDSVYGDDEVVPSFSQDLNQVPALRGRAGVYMTPSRHALNPADGHLLASILRNDKQ